MILNIFFAGWVVLIVAIVLNIIALKIGIVTWYPFLTDVSKMGFIKSFIELSIMSKIFLFVLYPLALGFSAFLILKK